MSGEKKTRTVIRPLLAWNDENEERWLTAQERSGWHLKTVRLLSYTFEKAPPADVAYRLDLLPSARGDRQEYFGLVRDSGWEHIGSRGLWQFFRKGVVDGRGPEVFADAESRIARYRRLITLLGIMLVVLATQTAVRLSAEGRGALSRLPWLLPLQILLIAMFTYGVVKLALRIDKLRRP